MLPFRRKHKIEADYLGLVFMHFAGYRIEESCRMWDRMQKTNDNINVPEFLSTNPWSKNSIAKIKKRIPQVKEKYENYLITFYS